MHKVAINAKKPYVHFCEFELKVDSYVANMREYGWLQGVEDITTGAENVLENRAFFAYLYCEKLSKLKWQ